MENHPDDMPDVMVCSQDSMRIFEQQFGITSGKLSQIKSGYAGKCLGVYVWIDDRFDDVVFISGK